MKLSTCKTYSLSIVLIIKSFAQPHRDAFTNTRDDRYPNRLLASGHAYMPFIRLFLVLCCFSWLENVIIQICLAN